MEAAIANLIEEVAKVDAVIAASEELTKLYDPAVAITKYDCSGIPEYLGRILHHEGGECCRMCLNAFEARFVPESCATEQLFLRGVQKVATDLEWAPKHIRLNQRIVAAAMKLAPENARFATRETIEQHYMFAVGAAIRWVPRDLWHRYNCGAVARQLRIESIQRHPFLYVSYVPHDDIELEELLEGRTDDMPSLFQYIPYSQQREELCRKYARLCDIRYCNPIYVNAEFCIEVYHKYIGSAHINNGKLAINMLNEWIPRDLQEEVFAAIKQVPPYEQENQTNSLMELFPELYNKFSSFMQNWNEFDLLPEHVVCRAIQFIGDELRFNTQYLTPAMVVAALTVDDSVYVLDRINGLDNLPGDPEQWEFLRRFEQNHPFAVDSDDIDKILCGRACSHSTDRDMVMLQINTNYYSGHAPVTLEYIAAAMWRSDHCILEGIGWSEMGEEFAIAAANLNCWTIPPPAEKLCLAADIKIARFYDVVINYPEFADIDGYLVCELLRHEQLGLDMYRRAYQSNPRALWFIPDELHEDVKNSGSGARTKTAYEPHVDTAISLLTGDE